MKTDKKIVSVKTLKKLLSGHRRKGEKVAFTNGCFDLLHFGHICYLEKAKQKNRVLIVAMNSDVSVKKIKGKKRPILPERARARVIAALQCVDYVTIFNEETPCEIIKQLKPDILIKGADWKEKTVVGQETVKENGGKVELIPYIKGFSTTEIIRSIIRSAKR